MTAREVSTITVEARELRGGLVKVGDAQARREPETKQVPPPLFRNVLAVASLVVGLLGIPSIAADPAFGLLFGIIAVVLGWLGLRRSRAGAAGRGIAIAGVVLGSPCTDGRTCSSVQQSLGAFLRVAVMFLLTFRVASRWACDGSLTYQPSCTTASTA